MFSLQKSIFATLIAWLLSMVMLMGYSHITKSGSSSNSLDGFLTGLLFLAIPSGIVVCVTCMVIVTPLLCLLPKGSLLWRPEWASIAGLVFGPVAMYLWFCGATRKLFAPVEFGSTSIFFGVCSALTGALFAYLYSKGISHGNRSNSVFLRNESEIKD